MQKVLILGASGSFGSNCAEAFTAAGWQVRAFKRGQEDMVAAAKGMDVIVNGLNPPDYKNWVVELPKIAQQVAAAAKASGAAVIQPANVYNYGATPGVWDADTPHAATTKKGKVRIEMEQILRESGVQVILLRGGDFLDTKESGNFFDFLTSKLGKGKFIYPGRTDINHAWAYLPDMARAAVGLAEMRGQLAPFEDVPFAGLTLTGEELRAALSQLTGRDVVLKPFPWLMMKLLSPFWTLAREIQEMRYLWDTPHSLNGARLQALLPDFKGSDLRDVLKTVTQS
ncbi:MAG: epimerase [Rhodobacteraceae bacterium]|nr:epimerase [Paracoccaceae bacterium]